MKLLIVVLFSFSVFSYPQEDTAKVVDADSDLVAETDSLIESVDILGTNKDTASTYAFNIEPPSVFELISVGKIIWALIFIIVGFYVIKFITKLIDLFAEKSTTYRLTLKGIAPIVRITGWIIIIYIVIAGIFKPPVSTLIAVTASVGIAVGFAAQDVLKNIFGGIMILFDRPFQVGDKIEMGEYYGEVIKIGLRSTRIVTPDDSTVTIPNGEIMNKSVSNANYGEPTCQVVAEIYLPVTVDTYKVRRIAIEAAQVSKYIYLNKPITVLFFNEVKERRSYLKMRLKAYVMDIRDEFNFKSDMTEIVIRELLKEKIISEGDLF
jgi:MscS family membrane protein